jgi:hypothetical protein
MGLVVIALILFALLAVGVQRWQARASRRGTRSSRRIDRAGRRDAIDLVWTMAQGGLLWAWLAGWWLRADHTTAS